MYNGFISYSHSDCGDVAPHIQNALENMGKPFYKFLKRNLYIFRDQSDLTAHPHLWSNIEKALNNSEYYILLASPKASTSVWIKKEIDWWLKEKSPEKIILVIIEGELSWDETTHDLNWEKTNCLPHSLTGIFKEEPFWVDLRMYSREITKMKTKEIVFRRAMIKIISTMTGKSPREIESTELSRERMYKYVVTSIILILSFMICGILYLNKISRRNESIARGNELVILSKYNLQSNFEKALSDAITAYKKYPSSNTVWNLCDIYNRYFISRRYSFSDSLNQIYMQDLAVNSTFTYLVYSNISNTTLYLYEPILGKSKIIYNSSKIMSIDSITNEGNVYFTAMTNGNCIDYYQYKRNKETILDLGIVDSIFDDPPFIDCTQYTPHPLSFYNVFGNKKIVITDNIVAGTLNYVTIYGDNVVEYEVSTESTPVGSLSIEDASFTQNQSIILLYGNMTSGSDGSDWYSREVWLTDGESVFPVGVSYLDENRIWDFHYYIDSSLFICQNEEKFITFYMIDSYQKEFFRVASVPSKNRIKYFKLIESPERLFTVDVNNEIEIYDLSTLKERFISTNNWQEEIAFEDSVLFNNQYVYLKSDSVEGDINILQNRNKDPVLTLPNIYSAILQDFGEPYGIAADGLNEYLICADLLSYRLLISPALILKNVDKIDSTFNELESSSFKNLVK